MGHGRRGLSAWPFGLVAAVMAVWGAGCASDGDSPAPAPPLAGGWVLQSGGCEQRLLFEPGGGFRASLRVGIGQNGLTHTVAGTALATPFPAGGGYTLRISPTAPQDSTALAYCSQWWQRAEVALPFAQIAAANGFDPRQLHLRTEVSPTLGPFLVGTDASRTDRFALLVNPGAGTLTGIPLEAGVISPAPLFHALPADDAVALEPVGGVPVLNLPHRAFRRRFEGVSEVGVFKLLLNFTSALEVVFSGF
ncbi:MAG: hypothetical protein IIA14_01865, partial [SAR324 cluster bacterium]|nr:hypothetical protein [SAR324 cluster bacterium]